METSTSSVRLRRFVRHRHRKPLFVIQPRDHEVVKLVSRHRVISSEDIQLLISGSDQGILRRLQLLFHHGYLDRPRSQRQLGNAPMVYALGERGSALVAEGTSANADEWSEKNRQLGPHYLEHGLMVSRFQARLEHDCRSTGLAAIDRWLGDGAVRDSVHVDGPQGPVRVPVAPDAYFVLRAAGDSGRIHCFLEADRGTMTLSRFVTKLRGYFAYWRTGRAQKRFGMKNFLVLTVTRHPERTTNLLKAAEEVSSRGLRMFLFGAESAYQSTDNPRVLDAVWRTPGATGCHSLLE